MYHTAITSQGRYYETARGRAVATAGLGETLAEATFPLIAVAALAAVGWRNTWVVFGAGLIIILLPVCLWLLRGHGRRHDSYLKAAGRDAEPGGNPARPAPVHWTRKAVARDPRFYFLLPVVLAPSFISTGIAFHQVFMVEAKGWVLGRLGRHLHRFRRRERRLRTGAGRAGRPCRGDGHPALAVASPWPSPACCWRSRTIRWSLGVT